MKSTDGLVAEAGGLNQQVLALKRRIESSAIKAKAMQIELHRLQSSCTHKWQYIGCSLSSRVDSDMLHDWTMDLRCEHCEIEESLSMFAPPCPVHMKSMAKSECIKHLQPQEGQRNRHEYVICYSCTVPGCEHSSVWKLTGGKD